MKLRILVVLSVLVGIVACGEWAPSKATTIATEHARTATPAEATPKPTVTKALPTPTATRPAPKAAPTARPGFFSREDLIEDARQLADILEDVHPDPYIRGGGKIAFHRRLHQLLEAIPEAGMTREGFVRLLRPFVAAIGDGHTDIWEDYRTNDYAPGGVPLRFKIVEQSLYVEGVPGEAYRDLIGALLVSVEGVPLDELCQRQEQLEGTENEYRVLQFLAAESLWYRAYMQDLLPEWSDTGHVTVELQRPTGESEKITFELPVAMRPLITTRSMVTVPAPANAGFLYDLMDEDGQVAYLRVDHMSGYREAAEENQGVQSDNDAMPSATEVFRDMVVDMEDADTKALIVDLRYNQGGSVLMADILLYFLYGKDVLMSARFDSFAAGGGVVERYSDLYFEINRDVTIEHFNEGRAIPLVVGDYDFVQDFKDDPGRFRLAERRVALEKWFEKSPTFFAEYESGAYEAYYRPASVVVLVDTGTFSSGFAMARYLSLAGATLVGTPSSQAPNCFGRPLDWRLEHTGIRGSVSIAYTVRYPDNPEMGRVLPVHYPLTYEKLASYGFDPNAEVLYALELLAEQGE